MRHIREELGFMAARGPELATLSINLSERRAELSGTLVDLLLEACIRLLQPRRHAIELFCERAQLVIARNFDALVERTGADARCRGLDRLDRPHQPAGEED